MLDPRIYRIAKRVAEAKKRGLLIEDDQPPASD